MNSLAAFKDTLDRLVVLRPEHVSAIVDGGNGNALAHLRGGQTIAVAGSVEELWKLVSRQADLNKREQS